MGPATKYYSAEEPVLGSSLPEKPSSRMVHCIPTSKNMHELEMKQLSPSQSFISYIESWFTYSHLKTTMNTHSNHECTIKKRGHQLVSFQTISHISVFQIPSCSSKSQNDTPQSFSLPLSSPYWKGLLLLPPDKSPGVILQKPGKRW